MASTSWNLALCLLSLYRFLFFAAWRYWASKFVTNRQYTDSSLYFVLYNTHKMESSFTNSLLMLSAFCRFYHACTAAPFVSRRGHILSDFTTQMESSFRSCNSYFCQIPHEGIFGRIHESSLYCYPKCMHSYNSEQLISYWIHYWRIRCCCVCMCICLYIYIMSETKVFIPFALCKMNTARLDTSSVFFYLSLLKKFFVFIYLSF